MNVHPKGNCLIPILSSLIMYYLFQHLKRSNWLIMTSGKITTAPMLVSEYLIKNEKKHQIMNVHTKLKCFIPILSSLVVYYLFLPKKC